MEENNVLEMSTEDQAVVVKTMELLLEEADMIITKLDRTIFDLTKKVNISFKKGVIIGGVAGVAGSCVGYLTVDALCKYSKKKKLEKSKQEN